MQAGSRWDAASCLSSELHCPPAAGDDGERSDACAVGTWGMEAHIYALPSLKPLFKEVRGGQAWWRQQHGPSRAAGRAAPGCRAAPLRCGHPRLPGLACPCPRAHPPFECNPPAHPSVRPRARLAARRPQALPTDVIPRSALFAAFEGDTHLLYGLGDGQLVNYRWARQLVLDRVVALRVEGGTCPLCCAAWATAGWTTAGRRRGCRYRAPALGRGADRALGGTGALPSLRPRVPAAHRANQTSPRPSSPACTASPRRLDPSGPADRKKIALGTKPISLRAFR